MINIESSYHALHVMCIRGITLFSPACKSCKSCICTSKIPLRCYGSSAFSDSCCFSVSILWHSSANMGVLPVVVVSTTPVLHLKEPVCCCSLDSPSMAETTSWATSRVAHNPGKTPRQQEKLQNTPCFKIIKCFPSVLGNIRIIYSCIHKWWVPCSQTGSTSNFYLYSKPACPDWPVLWNSEVSHWMFSQSGKKNVFLSFFHLYCHPLFVISPLR